MNRLGTKQYEFSDHLGNVLVTILDKRTGTGNAGGNYTGWLANISSVNDYYPFGMLMEERSAGIGGRYGFQGQEKDNEIAGKGNTIDFKFRAYDPRIGRFKSVDPLTMKYPYYSSYQFAGNRVISCIDVEGLEDFYYLGNKIDEIKGDAIIEVVRDVPKFMEALEKFQNPDFNKGYNIIVMEGPTGGMDGITSANVQSYNLEAVYKQYKENGYVFNGFSKALFESKEFQQTLAEGRGLIAIFLPVGTISKVKNKSKTELFWIKGYAVTLSHEFLIHAMKKYDKDYIVTGKNKDDHDEAFRDKKNRTNLSR